MACATSTGMNCAIEPLFYITHASGWTHQYLRLPRRTQCSDDPRRISEATRQAVSPEYVSANWEASGGGALAVIPVSDTGKLPVQIPLFRRHTL
jgi:coronin-1B/1C/6